MKIKTFIFEKNTPAVEIDREVNGFLGHDKSLHDTIVTDAWEDYIFYVIIYKEKEVTTLCG